MQSPAADAGASPPAPAADGAVRPARPTITATHLAVVAVGAYNVGRISAAFDSAWNAPPGRSEWVTNRRGLQSAAKAYDPPVVVTQGDEIMTFHLGSTVVLVVNQNTVVDKAAAPPSGLSSSLFSTPTAPAAHVTQIFAALSWPHLQVVLAKTHSFAILVP